MQDRLTKRTGLDNLIERFVQSEDWRETTRQTYRKQLRILFKWLLEHRIYRPQKEHLIRFKNEQIGNDSMSATTVRNVLQAARSFFDWTQENDIWPNIARRVKKPKISAGFRKDYLSLEQYSSVIDVVSDARALAIFQICVGCGLRVCEISRLRMIDIEYQKDHTLLRIRGKGKDDRERVAILTGKVEEDFKNYLKVRQYFDKKGRIKPEKQPIFASKSPKSGPKAWFLNPDSVSREIKKALRKAGIDSRRMTAHSLRHTCANWAEQMGEDAETIQQMLGHADPKTTQIYKRIQAKKAMEGYKSVGSMIDGVQAM
jgi:integrase/recombinase XerC